MVQKKMSKSDPSEMACIALMDDADKIAKKLRKAKTDPEPLPSEVEGLEGRPEARNLVEIYAALSNQTSEDVLKEFGGQGFGAFKPALADLAVAHLSPISTEISRMLAEPDEIDSILRDGAERAGEIAEETMKHVRQIVGFLS